jgi:ABC-type sugar transport system substrate-binding protein
MVVTATEAAKKKGWEVESFFGRGDQVAVNNAAAAYIDRGFNAIINIASPNPQMTAVIKKANEAHIPFVSTFSGLVPGVTADIGSNNVVDGVVAATELVGRLAGEGHVLKFNWTVLPATHDRDRGFHAVVSAYPKIEVTEIEVKVPGQVDDTYAKMQNLLLSDTKHEIKAVWVGWDELAIPAVRAIAEAKRTDIFVVGMDGIQPVYDLIRKDPSMAATVAYDVDRMGSTAVAVTALALAGKQLSTRLITLKPCLVDKQTVQPAGQEPDFKNCILFSGEEIKLEQ